MQCISKENVKTLEAATSSYPSAPLTENENSFFVVAFEESVNPVRAPYSTWLSFCQLPPSFCSSGSSSELYGVWQLRRAGRWVV